MKKGLLFILGVAFIASMSTSCKKDYTCTCTVDGESKKLEIKGAKKKDAKAACDTWSALYSIGGGTCDLK